MGAQGSSSGRWLALISLALIGWVAFFEWQHVEPGPLSAVHARHSVLQSADGCAQCHGNASLTLSAACIECHAEIGRQGAERRGLHGALEAQQFAACGTCHSEHRGADLELVGTLAFTAAGVESRSNYDHRHSNFGLHGAHRALACRACHEHADTAVLPAGKPRYLGLTQACASCHADPHAGRWSDCESCHGQTQPFLAVAEFEHDARFPLSGGHAGLACTSCHAADSAHSVEALHGLTPPPPVRTCSECHEQPHAASYLEGVAAALTLPSTAETCTQCHTAHAQSFTEIVSDVARSTHRASGFTLEAPHAELDCAACHASDTPTSSFAERYPARRADDCAACHGEPHGQQFAAGPFADSRCIDCHATSHFEPSLFAIEQHARTEFALEGQHRALACTACHPQPANEPLASRVFSAAPQDCAACHRDPHRGQFLSTSGTLQGCEHCHDAHGFAPSQFDLAAHAATRFALHGAHREVACTKCHPQQSDSAARGDRSFRGVATQCAACHRDPHGGQFAHGAESITDCARCHETTSFHRSAFTEEEHARAGFALTGAHRAVSCERCHLEVAGAVPAQRRFVGTPQACEACHADVHRGRFQRAELPAVIEQRAGCARCHTTESFRDVPRAAFDHAAWTGFRLLGAHAKASCEQCHAPDPDPLALRRLRFASTRCADCHADPHAGQFRVGNETDCARCHAYQAPQFDLLASFDHDRDTRFRLDAAHAKLACSACHQADPKVSGVAVVRYKPLGMRCEDCHGTTKREAQERK